MTHSPEKNTVTLTTDELRDLCRTAGREGAREAINETLDHLGIDYENPHETRLDMTFTRDLRTVLRIVKHKGITTAVGAVVLIVFAIIGLGFVAWLKQYL